MALIFLLVSKKLVRRLLAGPKRLKDNYDAMMKKINGYKNEIGVPVGQITDEEAGRALVSSITSTGAALETAEQEAKESIINTFDSIAADMGVIATKDDNINQTVFSVLCPKPSKTLMTWPPQNMPLLMPP